jgi:hypothetical protein
MMIQMQNADPMTDTQPNTGGGMVAGHTVNEAGTAHLRVRKKKERLGCITAPVPGRTRDQCQDGMKSGSQHRYSEMDVCRWRVDEDSKLTSTIQMQNDVRYRVARSRPFPGRTRSQCPAAHLW